MRISGFSPLSSSRPDAFVDDGSPAMDVLQEHCRLMLCRAAVLARWSIAGVLRMEGGLEEHLGS
jgi:hypothetical protein